jgi:hypothetical protein
MATYKVRRPSGEELGPASLQELVAMAEAGKFCANSTLIDPDGREQSVMLEDCLAATFRSLERGGGRRPGRIETILGSVMVAGSFLMLGYSLVFPEVISMGGRHHKGGPSVNWGYWIVIFGILGIVGGFLIARGARERRRARRFDELDKDE